jgi:hypothetical protein
VNSKKNYFVKSMGQFYSYVVSKKVELNPIAILGCHPQIVRLQVVKFEVDGSVCCSCEFSRGLVLCADIPGKYSNLDESMIDSLESSTWVLFWKDNVC